MSSRFGALSKELGKILSQLDASVRLLLAAISASGEVANPQPESQSQDVIVPKTMPQDIESKPSPPCATIERIGPDIQKGSMLTWGSSDKKPKVKQKIRNEIDDIFDF
jgi:hypothetical protein